MKKKINNKGFTIVELVIVIAVIAILASVLIPTFSQMITKAKQAKIYSEANSIYKNYLTEELKDGDIPEYVVIKVDEDICIMYFKGEQSLCILKDLMKLAYFSKKVNKKPKSNFWFNLGSYWLRELDLNQRPSGYGPDELPNCSIPRY